MPRQHAVADIGGVLIFSEKTRPAMRGHERIKLLLRLLWERQRTDVKATVPIA